MTDGSVHKYPRPWREIAEEASREYDPQRMAALMQELDRALEEQILGTPWSPAEKESA